MTHKFKHTVPSDYSEKKRITDYAIGLFPNLLTKNAVKKAIKRKQLFIDGRNCETGTFLNPGQIIELKFHEISKNKVFKLKLEVLFEDEYLAIVFKPAGIPVSGNAFKTLENALLFNLKQSKQKDALLCPLPVHRLDNQTSGLVIIAKTSGSRIKLGQQFEKKEVKKIYHAVVIGKTPRKGKINFPIAQKDACTEFELIKTELSLRNGFLSLIKLMPQTGRTHQLRIHCEAAGFPILGDKLYFGNKKVFKGKGLFLSATELAFNHPVTKKQLRFAVSYPKKFDYILNRENMRFNDFSSSKVS
ncbi:MAG: RluA family pseudouridine synthase [Bacteroidales bacterium]|nr:RluA family pseudouridine synthase [Bacteroidales bacterium]